MGHLFLVNDSFELHDTPENKRDKLLINFCKALNLAKVNKDSFWGTEDIYSRNFSYGSFFYGFLLRSISEINEVESLRGISEVALSLFQSLAYAVPGLVNLTESQQQFAQDSQVLHYGYCGFDFNQKPLPYVGCDKCWHLWQIAWYSLHQNEIIWPEHIDVNSFLPNKAFSDNILLREVIIKEKEIEEQTGKKKMFDRSNIALTFHEEVMRPQGHNLAAYTINIGGEIARSNYYEYDAQLSANETRAAGNSHRTIYKIIGNGGQLKYISLDHLHGMFEFHNHKGEHLGEFKFDGSYNSKAEADHNFRTL